MSSDLGFQVSEIPEKGFKLEHVEASFDDYVEANNLEDIYLMRATKQTLYDDKEHRRWQYPFIDFVSE